MKDDKDMWIGNIEAIAVYSRQLWNVIVLLECIRNDNSRYSDGVSYYIISFGDDSDVEVV